MKLRIKSKHLFAVFFSFLSLLWVIPIVMVFLISMKDNREYMMTKLWELPESIWPLFSNWEIAMEKLHLAQTRPFQAWPCNGPPNALRRQASRTSS